MNQEQYDAMLPDDNDNEWLADRAIGYIAYLLETDDKVEINDFVKCYEILNGVDIDTWLEDICTDTRFKDDYRNPLNSLELATGYVEYLTEEK